MKKIKVLFLCLGNSARSQIAEALLKEFGGDNFEVHSAGLEPTKIHPLTVAVLHELGIDTAHQFAKPLTLFLGKKQFDYLITVCSNADERCPVFPGIGERLHWPFEDPASFQGTDLEKLQNFRQIRDQIKAKIHSWLKEQEIQDRQKETR